MKHEKPLAERLYADECYTKLVRTIGYAGCLYRDLWTKLKPLTDTFGQQRVETATAHLLTYDKQFSVNPPPLAQVMLRADVRKLAWGILGPAPEHPWHDAYRKGEHIPYPWEKPEPKAEEKSEEPKPEEPPKAPAKPKPTRKKKVK